MCHENTLILSVPGGQRSGAAAGRLRRVSLPPLRDSSPSSARPAGHSGDGTPAPRFARGSGCSGQGASPCHRGYVGVSSSPCPVPSGTGGQAEGFRALPWDLRGRGGVPTALAP